MGFEVVEEGDDLGRGQVEDREIRAAPFGSGGKLEQSFEAVSVTPNGMDAEGSLLGQVVAQKAVKGQRQHGGVVHDGPPSWRSAEGRMAAAKC